jgi:hypothetical protein
MPMIMVSRKRKHFEGLRDLTGGVAPPARRL